jgi:prophage regulatory protein
MRTIIRETQVIQMTGLSRSTIHRKSKAGEFPKALKLGANSKGWYADEIEEWVESRARIGPLKPD